MGREISEKLLEEDQAPCSQQLRDPVLQLLNQVVQELLLASFSPTTPLNTRGVSVRMWGGAAPQRAAAQK